MHLLQQGIHSFPANLLKGLGQSGKLWADFPRQQRVVKARNGNIFWNGVSKLPESGNRFAGSDVIVGQICLTVQARSGGIFFDPLVNYAGIHIFWGRALNHIH